MHQRQIFVMRWVRKHLKMCEKLCRDIITILGVLKEGAPWANDSELYINLIKESVRKDMKKSDCQIAF